jgi:hypothetical protein
MKALLPLIIFLLTVICNLRSFAQIDEKQKDSCSIDIVDLNGYFVRVIKKNDIKKKEKERNKRINGKSFTVFIDGNTYDEFFIPLDTNINAINWTQLPELSSRYKNEIYLRCTSANYSIFKEQFCINKKYLGNDTCKGLVSNKYYTLKSPKNKYCYQIFYISGSWLRGIASSPTQKFIFLRQAKYLNPSVNKINVYLLYRYRHVPVETEPQELSLWRVVP